MSNYRCIHMVRLHLCMMICIKYFLTCTLKLYILFYYNIVYINLFLYQFRDIEINLYHRYQFREIIFNKNFYIRKVLRKYIYLL